MVHGFGLYMRRPLRLWRDLGECELQRYLYQPNHVISCINIRIIFFIFGGKVLYVPYVSTIRLDFCIADENQVYNVTFDCAIDIMMASNIKLSEGG